MQLSIRLIFNIILLTIIIPVFVTTAPDASPSIPLSTISSSSSSSSIRIDDISDKYRLLTIFELQQLLFILHNQQQLPYYKYITTADMHLKQGRIYDARQQYQQILSIYFTSSHISHTSSSQVSTDFEKSLFYLLTGYCSIKLSLWDNAEQELKLATTYNRDLAHIGYTILGLLYIQKGLFHEGIQQFDMGLIYNENYYPAFHCIGSISFIIGDIERGLRMYMNALRIVEEYILQNPDNNTQASRKSSSSRNTEGRENIHKDVIYPILRIIDLSQIDNLYSDIYTMQSTLQTFIQRIQTIDLADFHRNIGLELINVGAFLQGQYHLRKTIALQPTEYGNMLLFVTLALPFVYNSVDEIYQIRAELVRNVREALEDRAIVTHPELLYELYYLTHQLPYMGLPSHLLMKDITRLFASSDAPVLSITSIDLYRTYPYALAHATGNNRWESFAPYRYQHAPNPPAGAFVRQLVNNYFIFHKYREIETQTINNIPQTPEYIGMTVPSTVIRVGILSYQIHDCPVGNFFHHLMMHSRGYAASQTLALRENNLCESYTSQTTDNANACNYVEAPTLGSGTQSRFLYTNDFSDWKQPIDKKEKQINEELQDDPMVKYGYVSIPGVAAFNITLFRIHYGGDNVTRKMNVAADQVVMLPSHPFDLEQARNAISKEHIDVLIASDPGIQPEIYSLLFSRMAPIQMAYWGVERAHTLTLGLPDSIDYYVVGDGSSDDQIQNQIQEQVVRLGDLGIFTNPPNTLPTEQEKFIISSHYGLLESHHMYLLPVSINAIHPKFDSIIIGILQKDPFGQIISFYDPQQTIWLVQLQNRLFNHPLMTNEIYNRIRFVKEIPPSRKREKWALMASVEVVLDTFPVTIGIQALEAFDVGTPVVTMNNIKDTLRSYSYGALNRMNITELITKTEDEYVDTAVRIGIDSGFRKLVKQKLTGRRASYQWYTKENQELWKTYATDHNYAADIVNGKWRYLPYFAGNISDPIVSNSNMEQLLYLQKNMYNDAKLSTLNDWLQFIGQVGRPYAEDREATELEISSSLSLSGKTNQKSGPKGWQRTNKGRKKLSGSNFDSISENEIQPS